MKTALKRIGATFVLSSVMACTSLRTIIADFDILGTGSIVDEQNNEPGGVSRQLVQIPRPPGSLGPYSKLLYEDKLFSAVLDLNSDFLAVEVENKSGAALQLRFDQATVTSNFQGRPLPLRVFSANADRQLVHAGKGRDPIAALPLDLEAGTKGFIRFSASYAQLFESRRLFGVDFVQKQPVLTTTGVGNSIQYRIPVDHGGKRSYWIVDLTAKQASARASYR